MNTNAVLPENQIRTIDVGTRVLVVGVNPINIAKFRGPDDRYEFMDVGAAKKASTLPGNNFALVIANGRIPGDILDNIQTLAGRSKVESMLLTQDGASILKMMESFPKGNKGVLSFEVPNVVKTIELRTPSPVRRSDPKPGAGGGGSEEPEDKPVDPVDPLPPQSLEQALKSLERFYDQFAGDHRRVTVHFRSLGFDERKISDGALYQRCLTIRTRRKRNGEKGNSLTIVVPPELLASTQGQELVAAIEVARVSQQKVFELAAAVAAENEQLRALVEAQSQELKDLPSLKAEALELRQKAEAARRLFGQQ